MLGEMKVDLTLLKIDLIHKNESGYLITIPNGGIQFTDEEDTFSLNEHLELNVTNSGKFMNVLREIDFLVYYKDSIKPSGECKVNLINILANDDVQQKIYKEMVII